MANAKSTRNGANAAPVGIADRDGSEAVAVVEGDERGSEALVIAKPDGIAQNDTSPANWSELGSFLSSLIADGHKPVRAYVTFEPRAPTWVHHSCGVLVEQAEEFAVRLSDGEWI